MSFDANRQSVWDYCETGDIIVRVKETTLHTEQSCYRILFTLRTFTSPLSILLLTYPLQIFISGAPTPPPPRSPPPRCLALLLWPPPPALTLSVFFTHRWNSVLSAACIRATMVFVTEVPMLEPMMMGTADLTSSTVLVQGKQHRQCSKHYHAGRQHATPVVCHGDF